MDETYDVVVIGGGPAGLSAAVALARSRRSVLVIDDGTPRNAPAGHVHNFLTRDGMPPAEIRTAGRAEVVRYGGRIEAGTVTAVRREGPNFVVECGEDGVNAGRVSARRLLVGTGLCDELPDIPGLAERWGVDVLLCPYCHGWEVRDQRIGVLATGPMAMHQALMFRQLSSHVTLLQHTEPTLTDEQHEQLHAIGVSIMVGVVVRVESNSSGLTGVRLSDDTTVPLDALVVAPTFTARAGALASLGLPPVEVLMGDHVLGTRMEADATGATAAPGVWVAGNVTEFQAQVVSSAAAGLTAGAAINADLIAEDSRHALQTHRHQQIHSEQAWEERYRARPQNWSGNPNPALVTEVAELAPGMALDGGSGEGADAMWLAAKGWVVTGAEFSQTALARSAAQAETLGLAVDWLHLDLAREPAPATYDLVSSFYLHMPAKERGRVFRHLIDAVAPGGTLLVVGHDFSDMETTMPRPGLHDMGWTNTEILELLGDGWTVAVDETRPRSATDPEGRQVTIHDVVLRAHRDRP